MPMSVPTAVKKPCHVIWIGNPSPSQRNSVGSMWIGMPSSEMGPRSSGRDNSIVGLFDWLPFGRKKEPQEPPVWRAYRDASDLVVEDGRGHTYRAPVWGARSVRVVA